MKVFFLPLASGLALTAAACAPVETPPPCATALCGCFTKTHMVFTGQVMDNLTSECIPFKTVILRDRDGTRVAEDRSRSSGTYRLEGDVDRSHKCVGGEPVIRDEPDPGQQLPTYAYLPRRTPVDDSSEQVDLFRVPYGTLDAGVGQPALCVPGTPDAGPADGGP